ncbi:hypothetical protein, partial [Aggregatibacter actinomycetemcomitans]|uniref:hypothetical protein n=1 Tax=Aggregatibacter actinomycetemcomitans TaxID=714 RepID=UPI001EE4800C
MNDEYQNNARFVEGGRLPDEASESNALLFVYQECSGTLIPHSSISGKIPSTRGFLMKRARRFFS